MTDPLLDLVWGHDELAELDPARRRLALRDILAGAAVDGLEDAVARVADAVDGYGPLTELMRDDAVTDVLVNGPGDVWVERSGVLERAPVQLATADDVRALADRLLARAGARADASAPLADGCLPDGCRIHVALPPVAPAGPILSIRRFPRLRFTVADLVARGMLDDAAGDRLRAYVEDRRTIVIGGSTGTGKTTLLNALLAHVGDSERIVTVEETAELAPTCAHAVSLVARPVNVEGRGAVSLRTLVRACLRMRPDRIVVGEVRGPEAFDALQALSTGHEGSLVTVHAPSDAAVVERLVSLALLAGSGATEAALERRVRTAVDVVVHLRRDRGRRRVAAITEI